jgi:hypothetical protein
VNAKFWIEQYKGCSNMVDAIYHNLFLAKAFPEWDFRYFSKERALERSLKAR